jgi:hypothetical protein
VLLEALMDIVGFGYTVNILTAEAVFVPSVTSTLIEYVVGELTGGKLIVVTELLVGVRVALDGLEDQV